MHLRIAIVHDRDDGKATDAEGTTGSTGTNNPGIAASTGIDLRIGQQVEIVAADGAKFPADLIILLSTATDTATPSTTPQSTFTVMFHSSCSQEPTLKLW